MNIDYFYEFNDHLRLYPCPVGYQNCVLQTMDVTIIDINRLSVAKAFRFSIIDSQISQSIVFDIDNMLKLCVISLISKLDIH